MKLSYGKKSCIFLKKKEKEGDNNRTRSGEVGQRIRRCRLARRYTQKGLAEKIFLRPWVIIQHENGKRRIPIERIYAIAEALSVSIEDLIPIEKVSIEDEREEILNLVRKYKQIKNQELRKVFHLLIKSAELSEKSSKKAERVEIAKALVKKGVSVDVIAKTIGLSVDEYSEKEADSIYCKIGKKIREWRLIREDTQEDLARKVGITTRHKISKYEQGRSTVPLNKLYEIAKVLSISVVDLLPGLMKEHGENIEDELPSLIEEYKKIENKELRQEIIKTLFEGILMCEEKVREEERIKVAKDLVKEGICIDDILC